MNRVNRGKRSLREHLAQGAMPNAPRRRRVFVRAKAGGRVAWEAGAVPSERAA